VTGVCWLRADAPASAAPVQGSRDSFVEVGEAKSAGIRQRGTRSKTNWVKVADFYLRDDTPVSGKLVSDDKNMITIEEPNASRIVVSAYSKRDVDTRTLRIRNVPEARYYTDLAEYFHSRTWDFRDDPDDFIQAIRCYERARRSLAAVYGDDSNQLEEIEREIAKLHADRQVWVREVESRTRLKKLEFEAGLERRLEELETAAGRNAEKLDELAVMKIEFEEFQKNLFEADTYVSRQLAVLDSHVASNTRRLNNIGLGGYRYRYYYYPPGNYYQRGWIVDPNLR
jgi:hypothetical protein